ANRGQGLRRLERQHPGVVRARRAQRQVRRQRPARHRQRHDAEAPQLPAAERRDPQRRAARQLDPPEGNAGVRAVRARAAGRRLRPASLGGLRGDDDVNANRQTIEVVVPVHNEEATVEANVEALLDYLRREFPFRFSVVIADNASTDWTPTLAELLAERHEEVRAFRLERKGRGLALRTAWLASDADVVSYMDVDLLTNLESFLPLVAPILSGHSELAIGTRLAHHAHVRRRVRREL